MMNPDPKRDLAELLGITDEAITGMPSRIQVAHILRVMVTRARADGADRILCALSCEAAMTLADDIEFAVSHHPMGVPQDVLMPPPGYDRAYTYQAPLDLPNQKPEPEDG